MLLKPSVNTILCYGVKLIRKMFLLSHKKSTRLEILPQGAIKTLDLVL